MATISLQGETGSPNSADPLVQVRRLMPHLDDDDFDLDAIDGEFYWRCCRPDIWSQIERYPARIYPEDTNWVSMHMWDDIVDAFDPVERRRNPASWVRLRDGLVTYYRPAEGDSLGAPRDADEQEQRAELLVFSNRWTGADVEKRIVAYVSNPRRIGGDGVAGVWLGPTDFAEAEVIRVAFTFVPAGGVAATSFRSLNRFAQPHIVVVVGPPLPPAGTIARLYDDIVLATRQWGTLLAGTPTQQEKRVALRTWAVGLLVRSGRKVDHAIREVCATLGTDEVTSVQFTDDRQRLVERVPEAQPFLYARQPKRSLVAG